MNKILATISICMFLYLCLKNDGIIDYYKVSQHHQTLLNKQNILVDVDYKLGYPRTELKCLSCGGHLGHLFNDGPEKTTGQRHCINSAALIFLKKNEKEKISN